MSDLRSAPALTLDIEHSLHADLGHAFFAEFSSDAKHLVCIRGHDADAAFVQLPPRYRPLLSYFLHPLDNLKYLHTQERLLKISAFMARTNPKHK